MWVALLWSMNTFKRIIVTAAAPFAFTTHLALVFAPSVAAAYSYSPTSTAPSVDASEVVAPTASEAADPYAGWTAQRDELGFEVAAPPSPEVEVTDVVPGQLQCEDRTYKLAGGGLKVSVYRSKKAMSPKHMRKMLDSAIPDAKFSVSELRDGNTLAGDATRDFVLERRLPSGNLLAGHGRAAAIDANTWVVIWGVGLSTRPATTRQVDFFVSSFELTKPKK
jgi:hypothetical protein